MKMRTSPEISFLYLISVTVYFIEMTFFLNVVVTLALVGYKIVLLQNHYSNHNSGGNMLNLKNIYTNHFHGPKNVILILE